MLRVDEDALLCDLAETYGIFDMRALPIPLLATLSLGLRRNSRIKEKMAGTEEGVDTLLLAHAVDRLSTLVWFKTKDGQRGIHRPMSMVSLLTGAEGTSKETRNFESPEDFEAERARIIERIANGERNKHR